MSPVYIVNTACLFNDRAAFTPRWGLVTTLRALRAAGAKVHVWATEEDQQEAEAILQGLKLPVDVLRIKDRHNAVEQLSDTQRLEFDWWHSMPAHERDFVIAVFINDAKSGPLWQDLGQTYFVTRGKR